MMLGKDKNKDILNPYRSSRREKNSAYDSEGQIDDTASFGGSTVHNEDSFYRNNDKRS